MDAIHGPFHGERSNGVDDIGLQEIACRIERMGLIGEEGPGRTEEECRLRCLLQIAGDLRPHSEVHPLDRNTSFSHLNRIDTPHDIATHSLQIRGAKLLEPLDHIEISRMLGILHVKIPSKLIERRQHLAQRVTIGMKPTLHSYLLL